MYLKNNKGKKKNGIYLKKNRTSIKTGHIIKKIIKEKKTTFTQNESYL